ncbi:hypothetical protein [Streptomyces sp. NPDC001348]
MSAPEDKAAGKLREGALDAQHAFGDLDGHRSGLLAVHDAVDDGIAYRAEPSVRVDEPVLYGDPILQREVQPPDSWWNDLAGTLEKEAAVDTGRVAVRQQYMERAFPDRRHPGPGLVLLGHSPRGCALGEPHRTAAPAGLGEMRAGPGRARRCHSLRLLAAPAGHCRPRPRRLSRAGQSGRGLAAEATVCAQLLQTVARGDNLVLERPLRNWADELGRR